MGIDATATAIVNSSKIPKRVLVSLFASSITLSMLSGPNIGGTKATLSSGAAVAIMNNAPTIRAVFLGFNFDFILNHHASACTLRGILPI
jgi:hypothetical protein